MEKELVGGIYEVDHGKYVCLLAGSIGSIIKLTVISSIFQSKECSYFHLYPTWWRITGIVSVCVRGREGGREGEVTPIITGHCPYLPYL